MSLEITVKAFGALKNCSRSLSRKKMLGKILILFFPDFFQRLIYLLHIDTSLSGRI